MRMVSSVSLIIFLGIVGLNYYSIGLVHEMNTTLQKGPLDQKDQWRTLMLHLSGAEQYRQKFLLTSLTSAADNTRNEISELENILTVLTDYQAAEAVRARSGTYKSTFESTVQA
jgi:hypothetical protein